MRESSKRRTVESSRGRRSSVALAWTLVGALGIAACGGDGPVDPPPPPPPTLDLTLNVGADTIIDADETSSFAILGGPEQREYHVIVQSASEAFGAATNLRLFVNTSEAAAAAAERDAPRLSSRTAFRALPDRMERRLRHLEAETRLRAATNRLIERIGVRPAAAREQAPGVRLSVAGAAPLVGDPVQYTLGVTSATTVDCQSDKVINGTVKFVGENFMIVEDLQAAGHFTDPQYAQMGAFLDDVVYPLNVDYFGAPADLDDNGLVVALITAEVNQLTPAGSSTFIAGFFWGGDVVFTKEECPASNVGELLYIIAPDPEGDYGDPVEVGDAREFLRTTVAHEFLHLIGTERRIVLGGSNVGEDTWLDEGLAHLAEELTGLAAAGLATRANHDLADVASTQAHLDIFNEFHRLNLFRFADFMLNPNGTPALGDQNGGDPQGEASLEMRGFAYAFTRWLGDRFGPAAPPGFLPGSGEQALFQRLASGGPAHQVGTANVKGAVRDVAGPTVEWGELLSLFHASLLLDDRGVQGADPDTQWLTWNLEELFRQIHETNLGTTEQFGRPFPLEPTLVSLDSDASFDFRVNASAARFFRLRGGATTPAVVLELTTQTGAPVPSSAQIQATVVRVR